MILMTITLSFFLNLKYALQLSMNLLLLLIVYIFLMQWHRNAIKIFNSSLYLNPKPDRILNAFLCKPSSVPQKAIQHHNVFRNDKHPVKTFERHPKIVLNVNTTHPRILERYSTWKLTHFYKAIYWIR